jgi:hypothetical protein
MFTQLLIKLGLKKDPKAIIESLLKELDAVESAKKKKKAPVKKAAAKKPAAKKAVKKAK